jgi:hypothetical protein
MNVLTHGIIHGKIIELRDSLDFPEGQEVVVSVKAAPPKQDLEELYRQRQADTGREIPE